MAGGYGGKRKKHWAVRRDNKKARAENDPQPKDTEYVDRRAGFPDEIHPGSYASQRKKLKDAAILAHGEDAAAIEAAVPTPPLNAAPKRRYGLWISFCGKKYSGMQMNEGVATIEAELERALFEAGAIAEANYGFLQKIGWSRAGRTDKGVHAAGQMVTAKLQVGEDIPAFIAKVNAALPDDIRVLDMVTTTKNFNAKVSCDKRTYEYLAPTFMFAPREIVAGEKANVPKEWSIEMLDRDDDNEDTDSANLKVVVEASTLEKQRAYRMSDETYTRLLRVLKEYEGTSNFHNFTSKLEPSSPKCLRYILSFGADKPFVENGMEWIRLRVLGQSFLLHHIRKMIGMAVEVVAGITPIETIKKATELDKMDLPKAPSVGLYLAQAHFDIYNSKLQESVQVTHPPLDFTADEDVLARVEQFKKDHIFAHIIGHEQKTRTYATWIKLLGSLPFDYAPRPYAQWKQEKEELSKIQSRRKRVEAEKAMKQRHASASAAVVDAHAPQ